MYLKCTDNQAVEALQPLMEIMRTLSTSNSLQFVLNNAPLPAGCAIQKVSDKCEVHLDLKVRPYVLIPLYLLSLFLSCLITYHFLITILHLPLNIADQFILIS